MFMQPLPGASGSCYSINNLPLHCAVLRVSHAPMCSFMCVADLKKKKKSLDVNPWVYFKAYKGKSGL